MKPIFFTAIFLLSLSYNFAKAEEDDICGMEDVEQVEEAFQKGARIDKNNDPLLCHVKSNTEKSLKIVNFLIKKGANVNAIDEQKKNALYWALDNGQNDPTSQMVKLLLNKGANPNVVSLYYSSPLNIAVSGWSADIVKLMLEKGANPNLPCVDGIYPIHYVRTPEVLKLLLAKGAKIEAKSKVNHTVLHFLAHWSSEGVSDEYYANILETVRLAVQKGANINAKADYIPGGRFFIGTEHFHGMTPLCTAVINNNPKLVKLLLELGADKNIQNSAKKKPIFYAKEMPEILELLK